MRECKILAFSLDKQGHWVAQLECGHSQHVRHEPPLSSRPWVTSEAGRDKHLGTFIQCPTCPEPHE